MNIPEQAAYRQPNQTQVIHEKKEFNYKGAVAVLCILVMLLLISNIGMIFYILKDKDDVFNIDKNFDAFMSVQDAIAAKDQTIAGIVSFAQDGIRQGRFVSYEAQEDYVLLETTDGVNYLYSENKKVETAAEFTVSVVEPFKTVQPDADERTANVKTEDLSFFDKTHDGKFILWGGNIVFTYRFGPVFRTNIRVDIKENWVKYAQALKNREMIVGKDYFYLCPTYFRTHLKHNALKNCVIMLPHAKCAHDKRLLQILFEKGVGLVVLLDHMLTKDLQTELSDLFMEKLAERTEDGNFRNAKDSLAQAMEQFRTNHSDFVGKEDCMTLFFPDNKDDFRLPEPTNPDVSTPGTTVPAEPENTITPAIPPEEAVDIYLNAFSQWKADLDGVSANYYYYGFLDLDFDGVLEMVATVNMGSGNYSHNNYYKIDLTTKTVKELTNNEKKSDGGGFDLSGNTVLYRNNADKTLTYYSEDGESAGAFGGGISYGPLWYEDSAVYSEWPFSISKSRDNARDPLVTTYRLNNKEISEAEYNSMVATFEKENTNLNLQWETCKGRDFDNAASTQRKEMLLTAYRSFRYDGFSFDNIKTEPTTQDEQLQTAISPLTVEQAENIVENAAEMVLKWITGAQYSHTQTVRSGDRDYGLVSQSKAEMKSELCAYLHESYFEEIFETYYIERDNKLYYRIGGFGLEGAHTVVRSDLEQKNDSYVLTMHSVYYSALGGTQLDEKSKNLQLTFIDAGDNWVIDDIGEGGYWFFTGIYFVSNKNVTIPDTLTNPIEARMDSFGKEDGMSVNLRKGPGTNNAIIKSIPDNSKIYVCGTSEAYPDWVFVCYLGDFGWTIKSCVFY